MLLINNRPNKDYRIYTTLYGRNFRSAISRYRHETVTLCKSASVWKDWLSHHLLQTAVSNPMKYKPTLYIYDHAMTPFTYRLGLVSFALPCLDVNSQFQTSVWNVRIDKQEESKR